MDGMAFMECRVSKWPWRVRDVSRNACVVEDRIQTPHKQQMKADNVTIIRDNKSIKVHMQSPNTASLVRAGHLKFCHMILLQKRLIKLFALTLMIKQQALGIQMTPRGILCNIKCFLEANISSLRRTPCRIHRGRRVRFCGSVGSVCPTLYTGFKTFFSWSKEHVSHHSD